MQKLLDYRVIESQQQRVNEGLQPFPVGSPEFERLVMDRAKQIHSYRQSIIDKYIDSKNQQNNQAGPTLPTGTSGVEPETPPKTFSEAENLVFQALQKG